MIQVEHIRNNPHNEWLVRQYESYRFLGDAMADKFIPRPYISLIFHFKDPAFLLGESRIELQRCFLAPIVRKAFTLQFRGDMDTLAVSCKASVFSRLFGLHLSPAGGRGIALPHHTFFPLWQTMPAAQNTEKKIALFERFMDAQTSGPYVPDAMDLLYDHILQKSIASQLKDIMKECFASKSTLLRNFEKRVGVNPKMLARIVRIDYLWHKIIADGAVDFQEPAFEGKYFDQAHFINDFRDIVGERPGYFFARNLNTVKAYSGKPQAGKK